MKFACSTWMMPGNTFEEKICKAAEYGFDGVEIRLFEEEAGPKKTKEILDALDRAGLKAVSLVMPGETYRKPLLTEQDLEDKLELGRKAIDAAAALDIPTIVCPEYGPQIPLPLFDHPLGHTPEQHELLIKYLRKVSEIAEANNVPVMIEPINRYETRFFYTLDDGRKTIEEVGSKNLFILADFFHMNIEETNIPDAIRRNAEHIIHVHLGDSNRYLPGYGHTDFRAGFAALKECGYDRFCALECSINGEPDIVFPEVISFLHECAGDRK